MTVNEKGWYELDLGRQPTLDADQVRVSVSAGDGWRVEKAPGLARVGTDRAARILSQERPTRIRVKLAPSGANVWDRLQAGS